MLLFRLAWKNLTIKRPPVKIARYTMLKHRDMEGQANPDRLVT